MAAESSGRRDEYLQHAARHLEFAREDHHIAERLRHMAEGDNDGRGAFDTPSVVP